MECSEKQDETCNNPENKHTTDEESKILSTINMECSDSVTKAVNLTSDIKPEESEERLRIKQSMMTHLSTNDRVFFRSLKEDEKELEQKEKIDIAAELLDRNYGIFLAKFGNHLLKEHLCYFENRSEEESLIVDLHLTQLRRALDQQQRNIKPTKPKTEVAPEDKMEEAAEINSAAKARQELRRRLLDHLSHSTEAHFRSQQVGEPDLSQQEKRNIAEELLDRSLSLFLHRFGTHLLEEHLDYFDQKPPEESYEVDYHLRQLRKTHCKVVSEVGIKNRRFEALKKLVEEGSYFCETEMRSRNPLLYEQLVGKFLSAEERQERLNNIDTTNITFVNLLLEQMDRQAIAKLRKEQEEAEDDAMEEEDSDEDSCDERMEDEDDDSEEDNDLNKSLWGEDYTDGDKPVLKKKIVKKEEGKSQEKVIQEDVPELSEAERRLLMDEFRSSMFSSFLQGKDTNFDYSQVDYNSDYDDLEVQGQDEEEKYFDEESSQDASSHKMSDDEDMLEQYMSGLRPEPTTQQLTDQLNNLSHNEISVDRL